MKRISFYDSLISKKDEIKLFSFRKIVFTFLLAVVSLVFLTILSCGKNPNNPNTGGGEAGTSTDLTDKTPDSSSEPGWILIKTPGELIHLSKNQAEIANNNIKIMNNLDLQGAKLEVITEFDKIFDGNKKTIENFEIKKNTNTVGFIGTLKAGGVVENLGLKGSVIEGVNIVGSIVGNNSGTVSNCYSTGSVKGTENAIGGIVGVNAATASKVINCYNTGTVSGIQVGGIVGNNQLGTIENCYNTGKVDSIGTSDSFSVSGGIAGYNGSIVKSSYNIGVITGHQSGSLIGHNDKDLKLCYFFDTGTLNGVNKGTSADDATKFSSYPFATPSDWDSAIWKDESIEGNNRPILIGVGSGNDR